MKKKVHELETENSNYRNELPYFHKQFIEISKTLGSIDLQHVKLKEDFRARACQPKGGGAIIDPY